MAHRGLFVGLTLLLGGLVLALHSPFQLPVNADRAYLLYINQVAYFTGDIYGNTGFGYTPLGPLIAAGWFWLAGLVSDGSTVFLIRFAGMGCWLACLLGMLFLGKRFFSRWPEALLMAVIFAGFAVVPMMSAINLEPKMLVLLFELLALAACYQRRYFLAGAAVSLAAMCWQPAIVIAPALAVFLWLDAPRHRVRALLRYTAGGITGLVPVLLYLAISDGWSAFWQQAVLRKLSVEGAVVLDRPAHWLNVARVPQIESEFWLFIAAGLALGLFACLALLALARRAEPPARHGWLMLLFTLAWAIFNTLEFQSVADLIPLLPALCYWPVFLIWTLRKAARRTPERSGGFAAVAGACLGVLFLGLALYDLPRSAPTLTLAEQRQQLAPLGKLDRPLMTFDFEEFHVLRERPLPTKYIRYNIHDDFLIERMVDGGCDGLIEQLNDLAPGAFILRLRGPQRRDRTGLCAKRILARLAKQPPMSELSINGNLRCVSCASRVDPILIYTPARAAPSPDQGDTLGTFTD